MILVFITFLLFPNYIYALFIVLCFCVCIFISFVNFDFFSYSGFCDITCLVFYSLHILYSYITYHIYVIYMSYIIYMLLCFFVSLFKFFLKQFF